MATTPAQATSPKIYAPDPTSSLPLIKKIGCALAIIALIGTGATLLGVGIAAGINHHPNPLFLALGGTFFGLGVILGIFRCAQKKPPHLEFIQNATRYNKLLNGMVLFGPDLWEQHFGLKIEDIPPLPTDLKTLWEKPCPLSNDPKIKTKDTHFAFLIPKGLTLNQWIAMLEKHTPGSITNKIVNVANIEQPITTPAIGDHAIEESYWVLMPKELLPFTRQKVYEEQKDIIGTYKGYAAPNVLEAAVGVGLLSVIYNVPLYETQAFYLTLSGSRYKQLRHRGSTRCTGWEDQQVPYLYSGGIGFLSLDCSRHRYNGGFESSKYSRSSGFGVDLEGMTGVRRF